MVAGIAVPGYRSGMPQQTQTRRLALLLVVLGILVALGAMLLVGVFVGDDTDGVDPHQGEVATLFLH
jgi:hypothetical protein